MNSLKINSIQADAFREIGSIGCGNAITALSSLIGNRVSMDVPKMQILDFKDLSDVIGDPERLMYSVLVTLSGDISGMMMFMLAKDSADVMINRMILPEYRQTDEIALSTLQEIGNILASSYLNALAMLVDIKIVPSPPYLAQDMCAAIMSVPAIEFGKMADKVLFIESVFSAEIGDISGFFLLVPDLPSFNLIMSRMGV